ncbi:MAG: hypothetical protein ABIJ19_01925 [Patescibacteria group bacterium]|nr:hypothetical protein [Patescibacteria group bacterium]
MIKLIKEYKVSELIKGIKINEGVRVYHCSNCNHDFNVPKGKTEVKCLYCGKELKEEKL